MARQRKALQEKNNMGSHRFGANLPPKCQKNVKQMYGEVSLLELSDKKIIALGKTKYLAIPASRTCMDNLGQFRWDIIFRLWNYNGAE